MSLLPVMPIVGGGQADFQPISAEDVADCVMAVLPGGPTAGGASARVHELAGPETLSYREIVRCVLRALRRHRAIVGVPTRNCLPDPQAGAELLMGPAAFATWDESGAA